MTHGKIEMTDQELLEYAANATARRWRWEVCQKYGPMEIPHMWYFDAVNEVDYFFAWNPLQDNDDAFKLMTQLRMRVQTGVYDYESTCTGVVKVPQSGEYAASEINDYDNVIFVYSIAHIEDGNDLAAVRRSITEAAANYSVKLLEMNQIRKKQHEKLAH